MYLDTDSHSQQSVAETLDALNAKAEGLTQAEAGKRLEQDGFNEIQEHEETLWHRIFRRFRGPIPWMIETAAYSRPCCRKWTCLPKWCRRTSTLSLTRCDGWFWKKPYPPRLLFNASFSTAVPGALIAVYGLFIGPIGWQYALWIWACALTWFVINDAVKVVAYKFLRDREHYFQPEYFVKRPAYRTHKISPWRKQHD